MKKNRHKAQTEKPTQNADAKNFLSILSSISSFRFNLKYEGRRNACCGTKKINFMEDNFGIRSFVCVESYVNLMDS